jgi:hypothetical protein
MEYCDDTLKSKFINSEYDNPAKVGNIYSVQVGQMEELARYAMHIRSQLRPRYRVYLCAMHTKLK